MLTLDFMNEDNEYSFEEIVSAVTGGSIDNFKGDKDFLDFFISYGIGKFIEGDMYKEYSKYDGLLNFMYLDYCGYFGEKLYKIYEICGKDKMQFLRTCALIGKYVEINRALKKETIDANLSLENPVSFVDDNIILSDGTIPKFDPLNYMDPFGVWGDWGELRDEYHYECERSLRRRINESIRTSGENVPLLEEMISYCEKEKKETDEKEALKVSDDHKLRLENVYFGKEYVESSGFSAGMMSWFENLNFKILNYHVFRSLPEGEYFLVDDLGNVHIPDEIMKKGNVEIGPNSVIRKVSMANIRQVLRFSIEKLVEEDSFENEEFIFRIRALLENLELHEEIALGELKKYQDVIAKIYELVFGSTFGDEDENNYSDENKKPNK